MNLPGDGKIIRKIAAALLAGLLAACGQTPPPAPGPVAAVPIAELGQADYADDPAPAYRLRAADIISVKVLREPDLSIERVPVGADGLVSVPLAGQILARGQTSGEFAETIARGLSASGLKRPQVSVNVLEYSSHLVTVEGSVVEPGVYDFQPGARLSSALSLAKGPSRVAKLDEVAIFRSTASGLAVARFDYGAIRQGTMIDPVIQPGDRVVVGLSGLSQFWQDVLRAVPFFAVFTNLQD